ncbi:alpha/beta fold hydrolase [Actinomadura yumaensis]|uniref:Alpha/beta fold hydrolase n=1 Tax=Actinomadura yumaensis TaxID=111807 RepID=A0ABW2CLY8_9ACTN
MSASDESIVEAGSERVHVAESGPPDGPPLLVTSGLGGAWFDWAPTLARLDGTYRLTVFDRPGLGRSPAGNAPPSLRREVAILAGLAARAGEPVTVVAHSMGGFHAEAFARQRPDLVKAMVLVDPSYEHDPSCKVRLSAAAEPVTRAIGAAVGATRLPWLLGPAGRRFALKFASRRDEPVPADVVRSVYGRGTVLATMLGEELAYREMAVDLEGLRERLPFPPIPLVVLTALGDVKNPRKAREWAEGHRRLAEMTPYGRQVELPGDLHLLQLDRPDAIADAVAEVHARRPGDGLGDGFAGEAAGEGS